MKNIILFTAFVLFVSFYLPAQSNFNIQQYKTFLQAHQNLTSDGLMQMYNAGKFTGNIHLDYNSAQYFDSIAIKYGLTDAEKAAIQKNGFMVSERLSKDSFGGSMLEIFQKDLPVFVSTDAILHAVHISYDRILSDVELYYMVDTLKALLSQMHSSLSALNSKYASRDEMKQMLLDADVYITVPCKLLGLTIDPFYPENSLKITGIINKINAASGMGSDSLFSSEPVLYDWSQFKPRGHYTDIPALSQYFRAMMWLGRIEIYLLMPEALNLADKTTQYKDIRRETIDAMLVKELYDTSQVATKYNFIETYLKLFVGDQDNVTIDNLGYLKNAVNISRSDDLLDSLKLVTFQDTLKNQSFANQLILSQLLINDPYQADSVVPASSFLMFGQRFIIDSYVTAQVVYDRIKACRLMPSMLDPMFALGNDASAQLLKDELDKYNYSGNLASLRYLINSYDDNFWQSSMYNMWLKMIKALNPPPVRDSLPSFMRTGAFWQEKLNTQLSSWTQLRHDNLLYAKQSYTGMTTCSFPYTYIEPFPEFYESLQYFAKNSLAKFDSLKNFNYQVIGYFENLIYTTDNLISISKKELNHTPFSDSEISFLKRVIYNQDAESGGMPYAGWYANMFYNDNISASKGFLTSDNIVADVHTVPTDCEGNMIGYVKHVGTGPVNLGVFIADLPDGTPTAFIGPVLSFYEYTTMNNFQRLTDQEWNDTYLTSALRPSWVNAYLLDNTGNAKPEGLNLLTSVVNTNKTDNTVTGDYLVVRNYPNPFNPSTTIAFQVPSKLAGSDVELTIYNIEGQVVRRLLHKNMEGGNYLTSWDATNDNGVKVASGTYICNLKVGNNQKAEKIILLK